MEEFADSVFWYGSQRAAADKHSTWQQYLAAVLDTFFEKEVMAASCARGAARGAATQRRALEPSIVDGIVGKFLMIGSWVVFFSVP